MDELLETFDALGNPRRPEPRHFVHRNGLWHRSSNVFLFDGQGRLYLQRRAEDKDVCPGLWDLSVGEHLKPGESYLQAATRGLWEELSIRAIELSPIGETSAYRLEIPELGIHDFEFQQCYRGIYEGTPSPDPREVAALQLMTARELVDALCERPDTFTPWFRFHAKLIELDRQTSR